MSQLCDIQIHVNGHQTFFLNEVIKRFLKGKKNHSLTHFTIHLLFFFLFCSKLSQNIRKGWRRSSNKKAEESLKSKDSLVAQLGLSWFQDSVTTMEESKSQCLMCRSSIVAQSFLVWLIRYHHQTISCSRQSRFLKECFIGHGVT